MFLLLTFLFVILTLTSCKSAKANDSGETTSRDVSELTRAMDKDGLEDDDIISTYLQFGSDGEYKHNVTKSPTIYIGFGELGEKGTTVTNAIIDYFKNNQNSLTINPAFIIESCDTIHFVNASYNSISDKNIASLGTDVTGEFGGRIIYQYNKDRKGNKITSKINRFQIEIPKNMGNECAEKIQWIILHELGHAFGLKDIKNTSMKGETVMYYSTDGFNSKTKEWKYYTSDELAFETLYDLID